MNTKTTHSGAEVDSSTLLGWFCTLLHDFPEPEGIVMFSGHPQIGQRFLLPSSKFKDEWEVSSVNDDSMSFTAIKPTPQ